jgi:transcriptional regulator with XRE-family HTH domain
MGAPDEHRRGLGRAVREHRMALGLTRAQAARRWGVTSAWLMQLERGAANPPLSRLLRLGAAMGISLSGLFRRAEALARRL